ncbi:trypsin alpha-like [Scaptodrosophila lebanonensis]|uniref:trypsin n=1 Tax=Drosophila lebanonensis TaxID=7225 RepID=A0A6J2UE25_DROLE|nr:trypsin alpha-like [Scaptodrosophila lebanonensis]
MRFSVLLMLLILATVQQKQKCAHANISENNNTNILYMEEEAMPELHRVRRVVGGHRSEVRQQPYMVNIRRRGKFHCGGSLVTPLCVLTAAHCVYGSDAGNYQAADFVVRGGVTYLKDMRNGREVQRIFLPKAYNRATLDHDVAIFRLNEPLQGPQIGTIALARRAPWVGSLIRVSGWGLTDERSAQIPNQLHSVQVRVLAHRECQQLYRGYRNITSSMYCASVPGFKDACAADSGGPAVDSNGKLAGIVSWGKANSCAHEDSPGVYANVVYLRNWITQTMRQYCYR